MNKLFGIALVIFSLLLVTQNNFAQNKNTASDKGNSDFPQKAYSGGMMEVQLGKLAQQNGSSNKVKQFGERMVIDHSNANKELKQIALKNNITLPDSMLDENKDIFTELSIYNGAEFDKHYMDKMVEDHKKDISEFEDAAKNAENQYIMQWARKTLPTLRQHLKMSEEIQKNLDKQKSE